MSEQQPQDSDTDKPLNKDVNTVYVKIEGAWIRGVIKETSNRAIRVTLVTGQTVTTDTQHIRTTCPELTDTTAWTD